MHNINLFYHDIRISCLYLERHGASTFESTYLSKGIFGILSNCKYTCTWPHACIMMIYIMIHIPKFEVWNYCYVIHETAIWGVSFNGQNVCRFFNFQPNFKHSTQKFTWTPVEFFIQWTDSKTFNSEYIWYTFTTKDAPIKTYMCMDQY